MIVIRFNINAVSPITVESLSIIENWIVNPNRAGLLDVA